MDEINAEITEFNPTKAALIFLADEAKAVVANCPLTEVKEVRIKLKNARVAIEKEGKVRREKALAYQKAVIAKEKELVAIIEPEEDRLAGIEEEHKQAAIKAERERKLPERKKRLTDVDEHALEGVTDGDVDWFLNGMDDLVFEAFYNKVVASKNAADAAALNAEKQKIAEAAAEQARIEREKEQEAQRKADVAAAEEKGRRDAEQKAEEDRKREEARIAAENEQKEKDEAEAKKKLERSKRWTQFKSKYAIEGALGQVVPVNANTTAENYVFIDHGDQITVYGLVGVHIK